METPWVSLAVAVCQAQQHPSGDRLGVSNHAARDHLVDLVVGEPLAAHVLLFSFAFVRSLYEIGGEKDPAALTAHSWRYVELAEQHERFCA